MFAWFKKLRNIVKWYSRDLEEIHKRIAAAEKVIRDRTDISVDVRHDGYNTIIVTGQYKGVGYVQTYAVNRKDLAYLIEQLRDMERYGAIRNIDSPPTFHGTFPKF